MLPVRWVSRKYKVTAEQVESIVRSGNMTRGEALKYLESKEGPVLQFRDPDTMIWMDVPHVQEYKGK